MIFFINVTLTNLHKHVHILTFFYYDIEITCMVLTFQIIFSFGVNELFVPLTQADRLNGNFVCSFDTNICASRRII